MNRKSARNGSHVLVMGGGLAGMAAAWRLMAAGHRVALVERRPYLGGRAYSFVDKDTGRQVDNGQHVFLGCCTAYADFLRELGTLDMTYRQRSLSIEVRSPIGRVGRLKALPLPAPLHLLPSFLTYPHIGLLDKFKIIAPLLKIWRRRSLDSPELKHQSFRAWLLRNGQSDRAIANLWDLIVVPALNDSSADVTAAAGFLVFQEALLKNRHGADVGYAKDGLSAVMGDAVERQLRERGAVLRLGHAAVHVDVDGDQVAGVTLANGETLHADWYVSALPPDALLRVLPASLRSTPAFAPAATHTWSPIVNLHVWYDRPVADFDFAAFVESPVQWVFNRSRICALTGPGEYVTVSLSGAWEWWPLGKQELQERFVAELAGVLPRARDAKVERLVIVKEQRATFRSLPDGPDNRLPSTTPLRNLVLAGDWTDTGWPATMEGAVRSGNNAAAVVIAGRGPLQRAPSMPQ